MILRSFSVILHSPTTLCPSVCPQCVLCLSALGFINNKKNCFLSLSLPLFPQPFMSPRYPGGPRPSLRMPNQVLCAIWFCFFWRLLLTLSLTCRSVCVAKKKFKSVPMSGVFSASGRNPWISASPAKQFGPDKTAR